MLTMNKLTAWSLHAVYLTDGIDSETEHVTNATAKDADLIDTRLRDVITSRCYFRFRSVRPLLRQNTTPTLVTQRGIITTPATKMGTLTEAGVSSPLHLSVCLSVPRPRGKNRGYQSATGEVIGTRITVATFHSLWHLRLTEYTMKGVNKDIR